MNERVAYWLDLCEYDLDTAKAMLETKRYLYVGFMCHQVAEKSLKGYHCFLLGEDAPYTHSLKRLVGLTSLDLSQEQQKLLVRLENMNVKTRYPTVKNELAQRLTNDLCEQLIEKTEGFLKWMQAKLLV